MKKVKIMVMMLMISLMFPMTILAEEVGSQTELMSCISTAGNTCKLTEDVVLGTFIEIDKSITLDLNGKSITTSDTFPGTAQRAIFVVLRGGKLVINDSVGTGKISVGGNSSIYSVVKLTKTGESADGDVASIEVNGGTLEGYYYAITGNGDRHNTSIVINGGTIKGTESTVALGIFNPQDGKVVVNGGTISGITGIEMRSGTLEVNGGTIIGNNDTLKVISNKSGSTTIGAGIAVSQHTTKKAISVKVSGGTIKGNVALYESNPQENSKDDIAKVSIEVTGGTFEAINGGAAAVYSENKTGFITGGTFNIDAVNYVKTGYESVKTGTNYVVSKISNEVSLPVIDPSNSSIVVSEVTLGVDKNDEEIDNVLLESLESSDIETDSNVEVSLEVETLDEANLDGILVSKIENFVGNATIASYFDITVAVRDLTDGKLIGTLSELTDEIEMMILLPDDLKNTDKDINRIYYVIREHDGKIEKIEAKLSDDGNYLVFKTDKFSTYALAYEDVNAEEVLPPKTYDGISTCFAVGIMSLICVIGLSTVAKKKRLFNN